MSRLEPSDGHQAKVYRVEFQVSVNGCCQNEIHSLNVYANDANVAVFKIEEAFFNYREASQKGKDWICYIKADILYIADQYNRDPSLNVGRVVKATKIVNIQL